MRAVIVRPLSPERLRPWRLAVAGLNTGPERGGSLFGKAVRNKIHCLMAKIITWSVYEFKRIEFDNCTSAGPHFRIGVFTSPAAN